MIKKNLFLLIATLTVLTSCKTTAPNLDYQSIAKAALITGIELGPQDNHKLYINSAQWIGTPYRNGGKARSGVDCSGFTQQIYSSTFRKNLKRNTEGQLKQVKKIRKSNLQEGDLVFFSNQYSKRKVGHVGIYLKDGYFIHASSSKGVMISHLQEDYYKKHWLSGGRL